MGSVRATVTLCLLLVAVVVGMFVYSVTRTPVLSEAELKELGVFVLPRPRELAEVALVDDGGQPFGTRDLEGYWSFLFFGFTNCPDICPTSMAVMAEAERRLGPDASFRGVLVTVDPERDDPAALRRYVKAFSPSFVGLGGATEDVGIFARQLNVAFAKVPVDDGYQVDHSANIVIVNPQGHYHGFIKMPHQADTIVRTYESLASG